METKKFKINATEKNKGGKFVNHKIVLAAGATTLTGFSAGVGYAAMAGFKSKDNPEDNSNREEVNTQSDSGKTENELQHQPEEKPQTETEQESTSYHEDEYQPTDNGETINSGETSNTGQNTGAANEQTSTNRPDSPKEEINESTAEDIDPYLVAQAIAHEVDPNDIDGEDILTIDEFGTAFAADGSEVLVAVAHTPDGQQFMLTDMDGDGIFDSSAPRVPFIALSEYRRFTLRDFS